MKDNFEKAFKEKLENFEAPHDASAWEAMNERLDARRPSTGTSTWKWVLATSIVAATAIIGIVLLNSNETTTDRKHDLSEVDTPQNENVSKSTDDATSKTVQEKSDDNQSHKAVTDIDAESSEHTDNESSPVPATDSDQNYPMNNMASEDIDVSKDNGDHEVNNLPDPIQQSATNERKHIIGHLSSRQICNGEQVAIMNKGAKNEVVKFEINGELKSLKKAHKFLWKPDASIDIQFLDETNSVIGTESISVYERPEPDFTVESNIFENGLPVTICETYDDYQQVIWNFDGQSRQQGTRAKYHFIEKGDHNVTLQVEDKNGCVGQKTKTIRLDKKYNLLAVDAFKPHSSNPKTNTFMPFSLTQRDVAFTLTIFDPNNNDVIYQTSDANEPWDGTDQRTGKMTSSEKVYIWKVQLENPLPHERGVYAGTIVHN